MFSKQDTDIITGKRTKRFVVKTERAADDSFAFKMLEKQ